MATFCVLFEKFGRREIHEGEGTIDTRKYESWFTFQARESCWSFFLWFHVFSLIFFILQQHEGQKGNIKKASFLGLPSLVQFVKRRCSSTSSLRGFISCSYPGLKAGWSLTGGVQLRKLSWECSSEIVLTIPACWKMCLGPGGLGNPVYFILELVKVV